MLFVGDDWAEDHHDVELQDTTGRRLARARLPEGLAGIARLHELIAAATTELDDLHGDGDGDGDPGRVWVGIETDRGPWVQALVAAGYRVFAVNPRQVARYRERHGNAGAKSDVGDAHALADMLRTDGHQLRAISGDSPLVAGLKVMARAHQTLIWERTRHTLRLRAGLREYFPAAVEAFDDLAAVDALELLAKAPDPGSAARLTRAQIEAALRHAHRHDVETKAVALQAALRVPGLTQPAPVTAAFAAVTESLVAVIATVNTQIKALGRTVGKTFDTHPKAEILRSSPGSGRCSRCGCWPSSATTPSATPVRGRARTTPRPARSPASRARS